MVWFLLKTWSLGCFSCPNNRAGIVNCDHALVYHQLVKARSWSHRLNKSPSRRHFVSIDHTGQDSLSRQEEGGSWGRVDGHHLVGINCPPSIPHVVIVARDVCTDTLRQVRLGLGAAGHYISLTECTGVFPLWGEKVWFSILVQLWESEQDILGNDVKDIRQMLISNLFLT